MTEKLSSLSLCLLGWLRSVNPVRNLWSLCGFLLKSGFLENTCFVGQQVSPRKGLLVLIYDMFCW